MTSILVLAAAVFGSFFRGRRALILENLALRQQLAVYKRVQKRPRLRSTDRAFWVWLSKLWDGWRTSLILVRPETVIRWHRQGFRLYWRRKSRTREIGRPTIPREHIDFIRRMSAENPSWGEDKIFEELDLKFGIKHSTSTIRKYMVKRRSPGDRQTWKTFLKNHGRARFSRTSSSLDLDTARSRRTSRMRRKTKACHIVGGEWCQRAVIATTSEPPGSPRGLPHLASAVAPST